MSNNTKNQIPGGPAIESKPEDNTGSNTPAPDQKGFGSSIKLASKIYNSGSEDSSLAEKAKEVAKEEIKKKAIQAIKAWVKKQLAAAAAWLVGLLGPEGIVIVIAILLLLGIGGVAIAGISRAENGYYGNKSADYMSINSSTTQFEVENIILGEVAFRDWYFNQYDEPWASQSYTSPNHPNATIKTSGCGCTSAAMVLKRYGIDTNPSEVCAWSKENGYRSSESGTKKELFKALAENTSGFSYKVITNDQTALKLLENGLPLILSVSGSEGAPFTSGSGHYIVLAGKSGDTIYVNNSARRKNTTTNISEVRKWFKHGYYLIYPNDLSKFVNE